MFNIPSDSVWAARQVERFPLPIRDVLLDAWRSVRVESLPPSKAKPNPARGVYSVEPFDDRAYRSNVQLRTASTRLAVSGLPSRVRLSDRDDFLYLDGDEVRNAALEYSSIACRLLRPGIATSVLSEMAGKLGVDLPRPSGQRTEETIRARLRDSAWWKRAIGAAHGRAFESVCIDAGRVNASRCIYASDDTVKRSATRRLKNRELLSSLVATNENGESFTLQDLVDRSVSNQSIRLAELMVRVRGFEEHAKSLGYVAEFYTLTAPSKFHAYSKRALRNPNYQGATPRDTQAYLNDVWGKVRSAWRHAGIVPFGPRVVEPHHDGTPHWHLLLFVRPDQVVQMRKIFHRYALEMDGQEKGAWRRRFTFKRIDPSKGSAVGYLAKYLAKNLDGHGTDGMPINEFDGEAVQGKDLRFNETAFRVYAWASRWGIRQFQMIGTASVTIWRELRRLDPSTLSDGLRQLAEAADSGDWAAYVALLGGATVSRDELPICTLLEERQNRYGETVKIIKGVTFRPTGESVISRTHEWTIAFQVKGEGGAGRAPARHATASPVTPRTRVTNCAERQTTRPDAPADPFPGSLHHNCESEPPIWAFHPLEARTRQFCQS